MKQVVRQIKERRKVEIQSKDIKYQLWRLDDSEFRNLRRNSLPIEDDNMFYIYLSLCKNKSEEQFNLAQSFLTLTYLFGKSTD